MLNSLIYSLVACLALQFFAWVYAQRKSFYSIVDVVWSYSFAVVALITLLLQSSNWTLRQTLLSAAVCIWSLRLGTHLIKRLALHFPQEDGRYAKLKQEWSSQKFFVFYMAQALSVVFLAVPFVYAISYPSEGLSNIEIIALALWLIAFFGESLADQQLAKFKSNPQNKGKTCEVGLWNYSRHPNYFFEWLIWVSYFLMAIDKPLGFLTIYCPVIMLLLLFRVTGIPATEAQALKSRGEEYRRYQQSTSVFFPWFKKTNK